MSKLLAVSFALPPLLTARSLQVARTLEHLTALGWDCTALTVDPASLRRNSLPIDTALETVYRGVFPIVRTRTPENWPPFRWLRRALARLDPPGAQALLGGKALWVAPAIRAGRRLLAQGDVVAIVSFAMPPASQVVGRSLARASGLPWIAHFSDPWSDSPYFRGGRCSRWLLDRLERRTIRDADLVVFVTQRTADRVMRKYPGAWRQKVRIIPHGYDPRLAPPARARSSSPRPRLRLVHTGGLYGRRGPEGLLRALKLLDDRFPLRDRLEICFVGTFEPNHVRATERLGLGGVVQFSGPRAYQTTLGLAAAADVCLLVDAPSAADSLFLPSKLVDYLMLRKPILGLTPLQGESADLLRRLGCRVVAPDDAPGIAAAVEQLLRAWEAGSLRTSDQYERVANAYDIGNTTRLLDAALRELVQGTAGSRDFRQGPGSWRAASSPCSADSSEIARRQRYGA